MRLPITFIAIVAVVWLPLGSANAMQLDSKSTPTEKTAETASSNTDPTPAKWEVLETNGKPTARHEAALVAFKNKLYLIGGRRINPVDVYDPETNTWTQKSESPIELHHFQAVVVDDLIYLIGAMTGPFPKERPLERVVAYNPAEDKFEFRHPIPVERRRGGAGAVLHEGKIYIVGGITNGHVDGYQPWLDVYDPKTGKWESLADAPNARDHFQAVVHGNLIYAPAGRTTSQATGELFERTVKQIDVYDIKKGKWLDDTPEIPTERAGNMAFVHNGNLIVGGGEGVQTKAYNEVEALDLKTGQWANWPKLSVGRHGSGFAVIGDSVYTASGCGNRGGSPELTSIERLDLKTFGSDQ